MTPRRRALPRLPGLICLFALLALCGTTSAATLLVPAHAAWRYLDNGSDQGTDWKELWFNDDDWGLGRAELGYGDALKGRPEATVLKFGPDPNNRYVTTYFRRFFYVTNAAGISNLTVRLLRDDGAVVYLNGTEATRQGMPAGPVGYRTYASPLGADGADETTYFASTVNPQLLVDGINLIAVELHQWAPNDSDASFDLRLVANELPSTIIRGPYLQNGGTTNITVRWRSLGPSDSRVVLGTAPNSLTLTVTDPTPTTEHSITLTTLSPGTQYYYALGSSQTIEASGADYHFTTAPLGAGPTRIWAMGDAGTAAVGGQALQMRDAYYAYTGTRKTDVWLFLGDNAYHNGTDLEYQAAVFDVFDRMLRTTVAWSTLGNHETYGALEQGRFAYFNIFSMPTAGESGGVASGTENYYSFNHANIHFVCLDSERSGHRPGDPMLAWLEEDLAANTNEWTIAFWHSPPYTKGSHNSDDVTDSAGALVGMRNNVVPILESYGVDLVLGGHSHDYERSYLLRGHYGFSTSLTAAMLLDSGSGQPEDTGAYRKPTDGPFANQGTVYVVAGSSGWATSQQGRHPAMYASILRVGSLVIDVDGHRLDAKFLRETGAIDDSFTILKGGPEEPLRVTRLQAASGLVTLQWKSRRSQLYRVERNDNLQSDVPNQGWVPASADIAATGATSSWTGTASPGSERSFYRVVEVR